MWLRPARQPPDLHVVVSTNRRSRRATYAAVCSKRATLLGNADWANRKLRCGRNRPSGWTLSVQVFGPGGTRSEYRSRIFWIDGRRTWAAAKAPQRKRPCRSRATARRSLDLRGRQQVAFVVALPHAAEPSPSRASLNGLDAINFFNAAMLAGFGPYVAVYLAEQKWTQENIGFVLTASGLAGLLALLPGGELLDTVRSKRALAALGASMVAVTALAIGIWPDFPVVFTALVLHGTTGAFLGPAIAAISL